MASSATGKKKRLPSKSNVWQPGDPITDADRALLKPIIEAAAELGFSPPLARIPNGGQIKKRFRIWNNALLAAGLPKMTDPNQTRLREQIIWQKRYDQAMAYAHEAGFEAAMIDTNAIVFDEIFLQYCEENLCGQYHANYSCPPACGTPIQMRKMALRYPKALVVKSGWDMLDWHDAAAIRCAKKSHNAAMLRILARMEEAGFGGLMCGASCCSLCDACTMPSGEACRFPDQRFSCLSAYCINVSKLAEACGMEYGWEEGKLGLYGMILLSSRIRGKQ